MGQTRTHWLTFGRPKTLEYPDGWGVYALHGVRVPKELVLTLPEQLKVSEWVVKQTNAEIRRAMQGAAA